MSTKATASFKYFDAVYDLIKNITCTSVMVYEMYYYLLDGKDNYDFKIRIKYLKQRMF